MKEQLKQALLERYTLDMYDKISNASVAIAGLGGLGSNIAVMLARAGVGKLFLVDYDKVELTNLNRQMYGISHLGQFKTAAMMDILADINPYLDVTAETVYVTEENAESLFQGYPIVCEAFDKPENKAVLINSVLEKCKKTTIVAGSGMAGYGSANRIVTRKKMKRLYVCGDGETELDSDTCLISSRVMVCAAHQANMVIRFILGEEEE